VNGRSHDRLFAALGIAAVVVELVGTFVSMGSGKIHTLTWASSTTSIAHAFSKTAERAITAAGGSVEVLPLPWGDRRPPAKGNQFANR